MKRENWRERASRRSRAANLSEFYLFMVLFGEMEDWESWSFKSWLCITLQCFKPLEVSKPTVGHSVTPDPWPYPPWGSAARQEQNICIEIIILPPKMTILCIFKCHVFIVMPKICIFHCQKLILSVLLLCFSYPGACFEKNPLKTAAAAAAALCILNN